MKAKKIVLAAIIFATIANISILPFACSTGWATVTTIKGSADQTSKTFSINAQEWRLQWSYTPNPDFPDLTFFGVLVYPEGEGVSYVDSFYVNGSTQTNGIENINEGIGNYHLEILDANIPSYTIVVQQYGGTISRTSDGNSDFGNLTNVILVVLVLAIFTLAAVVVFLKRRKNRKIASALFLAYSSVYELFI
jgi:hypothetical protein